jgi:hypothetical protein
MARRRAIDPSPANPAVRAASRGGDGIPELRVSRTRWDELAEFSALAERHAHVAPSSAAVELRTLAEQVVLFISRQRHDA